MTAQPPSRLDDATLPLKGRWRVVEGAIAVPPIGPERPQICGVFDAAGRPVLESLCYCGSADVPVTTLPDTAPTAGTTRQQGTWLFGGVISGHFGHMLCEATGRLWALDEVPDVTGILFFARPFDQTRQVRTGFMRLAHLMDLPQVTVTAAPVTVDRLILPEQGLGSEHLLNGRPESRRFLRDRLARVAPDGAGRRLYLTRTGQPARRGKVLDEAGLEHLFAAAGYEVIRPEDHPMSAQVAMFRAASHIVATEGSPLHLASFAAPATCNIAVIRRRISPVFGQICESLRWFIGQPPLQLTQLRSIHGPKRARNVNLTYLEPSRPDLRSALIVDGFLGADTPAWPDLTDAERDAAVAELAAETGHTLIPVDPPATDAASAYRHLKDELFQGSEVEYREWLRS